MRGQGRYTDDINLAGQAYAVIVRSRARARRDQERSTPTRRASDAGRARRLYRRRPASRLRHAQMRRAVQEPRRLRDEEAGRAARSRPTRCASSAIRSPAWWPRRCCKRKTPPKRSRSTSSRCPAVTTPEQAVRRTRRSSTTTCPGNVALDFHLATAEKVDAAFAAAAHKSRLDARNTRVVVNAMEPRAAIGDYDKARTASRCIPCCQGVFGMKASSPSMLERRARAGARHHAAMSAARSA